MARSESAAKRHITVIILLIAGIHNANCQMGFSVSNEIDLKASLLNVTGIQYVRPTQITLVSLSFNLLSVNLVDIKNEQLALAGWWSVKWKDDRLSWVNSNYGNIPVIQVSNDEIWKPALVVDNSVFDLSAIDEDTIPIRVRKDGQVTWNPPGILTLSCEMSVAYFPFDKQTCAIQVTSFGYTIQELNITVEETGLSTSYFSQNGEWDLLRTWYSRSEFEEDAYTYAKVSFSLELEHRPLYYGLNTLLPVLLTSLLIPLVFMLPHDAGEKIGYCLTVLLAYVVILTIVTDGLPTTAKSQSLLGVYIALVLTLSGISVFLSIHSLNIYHRSPEKPIPDWQDRLTRFLGRLVHPRCAKHRHMSRAVNPVFPAPNIDSKPTGKGNRNTVNGGDQQKHVEEEDDDEDVSWQLVAQVYDSLCIRIYFLIILVFSLSFLLVMASQQF